MGKLFDVISPPNYIYKIDEGDLERIVELVGYYGFDDEEHQFILYLAQLADYSLAGNEPMSPYDYKDFIDFINYLRSDGKLQPVNMHFKLGGKYCSFTLEKEFVRTLPSILLDYLISVRGDFYYKKLKIEKKCQDQYSEEELAQMAHLENKIRQEYMSAVYPQNANLGVYAILICQKGTSLGVFDESSKIKQYSFIYDYFKICRCPGVEELGADFSGDIGKEKYRKIKACLNAMEKAEKLRWKG